MVNKLMDIISKNCNIIRRNNRNELEVTGQPVSGFNFDKLFRHIDT